MENLEVSNNEAKHRFEINLDAGTAFFEYIKQGKDVYNLYHTEVPPQFEGHGVGSGLAKGALEYIKTQGKQIIPTCPFVAAYLKRHPEYQELVKK
jgi:predicted GNAT family acetyltransferase